MRYWLKITTVWVCGIMLAIGIASLGQFLIYLCPNHQLDQLATTGSNGEELFTVAVNICHASWYNSLNTGWMIFSALIYLLLPTSLALWVASTKKKMIAATTMLATLMLLSMVILFS